MVQRWLILIQLILQDELTSFVEVYKLQRMSLGGTTNVAISYAMFPGNMDHVMHVSRNMALHWQNRATLYIFARPITIQFMIYM